MNCPRCTSASLTELDRDGVTIDRCDRCRGIWLDRGELEKLMSRANAHDARHHDDDDDDRRRRRHHDDDDDDDRRRGSGRKRSWWEIFD